MQTKRELGQAYGELGRRAFDLIDAGKLQTDELDYDVERIRKLQGLEGSIKGTAVSRLVDGARQ